jgi:hypothetical protein
VKKAEKHLLRLKGATQKSVSDKETGMREVQKPLSKSKTVFTLIL